MRNVSKSTVTRAVARGDITLINDHVDVQVADIQWWHASKPAADRAPAAAPPVHVLPPGPDAEPSRFDNPTQLALKHDQARLAKHDADMAEMKSRQMAGDLIARGRTLKAIEDAAALIRSLLERMPDKLADRLAAEAIPALCHQLLTTEIDAVLADAASTMQRLSTTLPTEAAE